MTNKKIVQPASPVPSRRIIGGSTQRSPMRSILQGGYSWQYNHAPPGLEQNKNAAWWQIKADRFDAPLSSSGDVLYTRQTVQREIQREFDRKRNLSFSADFSKDYHGGVNSIYNKKPKTRDITFDSFEEELDITDETIPDIKKRVSFRATKDSVSFNGEHITPFSAMSSSVITGYRATLDSVGLTNIDLTNFHQDSILHNRIETPMQGPFTEQHVGGVQARHNNPLMTSDRSEAYDLSITSGTGSLVTLTTQAIAKGQYLRGAGPKAPVNIQNIKTLTGSSDHGGVRTVGNYIKNYQVIQGSDRSKTNMDRAFNPENYVYNAPSAFITGPSRRGFGLTGSADYPAPRKVEPVAATSLLSVLFAEDVGLSASVVLVDSANTSHTFITSDANNNTSGNVVGLQAGIAADDPDICAAQFIAAINNGTTVGSITASVGGGVGTVILTQLTGGVVGNRVNTNNVSDISLTNFNSGKDGTRVNKTIISSRFSAPGSKLDSKQQFRDVDSDQISPNNALPFRNMIVRAAHNKNLATFNGFGGFITSSVVAAPIKTQRNTTQRLDISTTSPFLVVTGNVRDNGFITRPVPAGDSTQWFMDLSGSDTVVFNNYVSSGSRYPENILLDQTALTNYIPFTSSVAASGIIKSLVTDTSANGFVFTLIDNAPTPLTVSFTASTGAALGAAGALDARNIVYGIQNATSLEQVAQGIFTGISLAKSSNYLNITPSGYNSLGIVTITQDIPGASGNTVITGTVVSNGIFSSSNFGTGSDDVAPVGVAVTGGTGYLGLDGKYKYIWDRDPEVAPWTQTRLSNRESARYYSTNNEYEIGPEITKLGISNLKFSDSTLYRTYTDRAGNDIVVPHSKRYKEPAITSRYKPLGHIVQAFVGTPGDTSTDKTIINMRYSYGNSVMGFANKELNESVTGRLQYFQGQVKRPYEVLREQVYGGSSRLLNGIDRINLFVYPETIYPQEVYTYLSGSRSRLAFENNFWRDDKNIPLAITDSVGNLTTFDELTDSSSEVKDYNRQYNRLVTSLTNSQGYGPERRFQVPFNSGSATGTPSGAGQLSKWPLDSFLWSDYISTLAGTLTASIPALLADAGTMASGELMMTHYGTINDQMTPSVAGADGSLTYSTSSANSSQYVYNVPIEVDDVAVSGTFATGTITPLFVNGEGFLFPNAEINVTRAPEPPLPATTKIEFGDEAGPSSLAGSSLELTGKDTNKYTFTFIGSGTGGNVSYDSASQTFSISLNGLSNDGDTARNLLFSAISAATSSALASPLLMTGSIDGRTDRVDIVISSSVAEAPADGNCEVVWGGDPKGSDGIDVSAFSGGRNRLDILGTSGTNQLVLPTFDGGAGTHTIDFSNSQDNSTASKIGYQSDTTIHQLAASIVDGINAANTAGNVAMIASQPAAATYAGGTVSITSSVRGTTFNGRSLTGSAFHATGSAGTSAYLMTGSVFAGGNNVALEGTTLILTDIGSPSSTHTFTFSTSVAVASSTKDVIGVADASSTNNVATAILSSIGQANTANEIAIGADIVTNNQVLIKSTLTGSAINGTFVTGSAVASGFVTGSIFGTGSNPSTITENVAEARSVGSVYSRPPWTAGSKRRFVDGENKGRLANQVYPFYDTYEKYADDIRLVGKDHTIVPEFRVSEHVSEYAANGSLFVAVSSSLELTGASSTLFDGTNTDFYTRYSITDDMEFLENFMKYDEGDRNFVFNNYPRHFELSSNAIIKMLPYNGFYPVNRTLQIAGLFSSSYGSKAVYTGPSASLSEAWRTLLRPFYAPGIMYNSIKSGLAVDYPIRRNSRNMDQFMTGSAATQRALSSSLDYTCLTGALSNQYNSISGSIPGNNRRNSNTFDWNNADVNKFFWADRLPFESILSPEDLLSNGFDEPTVLSDINFLLYRDVSASFDTTSLDASLYKKAVSNFLANVPKFFLSKKENKFGNSGFMTKFVSQFGSPSKGSQQITDARRSVEVDSNTAYMMEIGLMKTDDFNFYSNPHAYGLPTATGSGDWVSSSADNQFTPLGNEWPRRRGEFAPFTPPHYYGPSLVRVTFMPNGTKEEYTLEEILNNDQGEVFVQYLNESGSYYDATSGSFIGKGSDGTVLTTLRSPDYGWNRAWQNRMDLDASINISNEFPTGEGGAYRSTDPNKWTIMPKWECPILDFPIRDDSSNTKNYNFSSSVDSGQFTQETQGMWHQYGVMPDNNEGTYMYIKDIPTGENEEYDLVAITGFGSAHTICTGSYEYVKKVPKFVVDSKRQVGSLADLCGFDPDEIIREGFDFSKAKRVGELADDGEKSISEAILALPFYLNENGKPSLITLQAPADALGPKIKEFRKKFTKFSLPPVLAKKLLGMVPKGYPNVPDLINPFGGDDYDAVLAGSEITQTPVVYLMEHKVSLTRQDLADMWQGIMPSLSTKLQKSFSAIDHYMPGDNVEKSPTQFPEILKEQINLGATTRDGHPRYDLLDIAEKTCKQGFFPDIKWLVFRVKERGVTNYSRLVMEEVDGPNAESYDSVKELFSLVGLPEDQVNKILGERDEYAKNVYIKKHSLDSPTFNWPYDYCSLIELGKINTKVGFRPDLDEEYMSALSLGPGDSNSDDQ